MLAIKKTSDEFAQLKKIDQFTSLVRSGADIQL